MASTDAADAADAEHTEVTDTTSEAPEPSCGNLIAFGRTSGQVDVGRLTLTAYAPLESIEVAPFSVFGGYPAHSGGLVFYDQTTKTFAHGERPSAGFTTGSFSTFAAPAGDPIWRSIVATRSGFVLLFDGVSKAAIDDYHAITDHVPERIGIIPGVSGDLPWSHIVTGVADSDLLFYEAVRGTAGRGHMQKTAPILTDDWDGLVFHSVFEPYSHVTAVGHAPTHHVFYAKASGLAVDAQFSIERSNPAIVRTTTVEPNADAMVGLSNGAVLFYAKAKGTGTIYRADTGALTPVTGLPKNAMVASLGDECP